MVKHLHAARNFYTAYTETPLQAKKYETQAYKKFYGLDKALPRSRPNGERTSLHTPYPLGPWNVRTPLPFGQSITAQNLKEVLSWLTWAMPPLHFCKYFHWSNRTRKRLFYQRVYLRVARHVYAISAPENQVTCKSTNCIKTFSGNSLGCISLSHNDDENYVHIPSNCILPNTQKSIL